MAEKEGNTFKKYIFTAINLDVVTITSTSYFTVSLDEPLKTSSH